MTDPECTAGVRRARCVDWRWRAYAAGRGWDLIVSECVRSGVVQHPEGGWFAFGVRPIVANGPLSLEAATAQALRYAGVRA